MKRTDLPMTAKHRRGVMPPRWLLVMGLFAALHAPPAAAKGSGLIFITNEKSSTISVLDGSDTVVNTLETCARPRGLHFNRDRTRFFVGCADDSTIAVYDIATQTLVRRYRDIDEPETFDLHSTGHPRLDIVHWRSWPSPGTPPLPASSSLFHAS